MEGYGLNADIYINGVKCLMIIDEGNGGCFLYRNIYDEKNKTKALENITQLEEYIKNQPKKVFSWGSVDYDMDMVVDDILAQQEEEKHKKKLQKLQEHALIYGKPDANKYTYQKFTRPLKAIPFELLKTKHDFIKRNVLKNGEVFLNTNLKELGLV